MTARLNLTETHFEVQHAGPLLVLHPPNDVAGDWLNQHPPQDSIPWLGGGVVIKPRDLPDIVEGPEADGFDMRSL